MSNVDPYAYLTDPDRWSTSRCEGTRLVSRRPRVGEVVGFRYSAWRVTEVRSVPDVDLTDAEQRRVASGWRHPCDIELLHLAGPMIDGEDQVVVRNHGVLWTWLGERFRTCSCHGHPWPCQDYDRDVLVATLNRDTRRKLAGAGPGVCAACCQPITARQRTVAFPEPSLIVPGAPGPTFHAARLECWLDALRYETEQRIPAHPTVTRLVSCPGIRFVHELGGHHECTAGPACTGLHDPAGSRRDIEPNCFTSTWKLADPAAGYPRPLTDCGYRRGTLVCLGSETGPCRPMPRLGGLLGEEAD